MEFIRDYFGLMWFESVGMKIFIRIMGSIVSEFYIFRESSKFILIIPFFDMFFSLSIINLKLHFCKI